MTPPYAPHRAALAALLLALAGCVTSEYVGETRSPTAHVDVYYAAADVGVPYVTMGEVHVEGPVLVGSAGRMHRRLVDQARERGADGLIVGSLETRERGSTERTTVERRGRRALGTTTTTVEEVKVLRGTLIRYTGGRRR